MMPEDEPTEAATSPPANQNSSKSYLDAVTHALRTWLGFGTYSKLSYRGKTVLVTGASSGIGAVFAEAFANRCANLILTAHPNDKGELVDVAEKIRKEFAVDVETLVA